MLMANRPAKSSRAGNGLRRLAVLTFLSQLALRADQIIYDDALENGWQNWGWTTLNYANTAPVHSGNDAVGVTISGGWQGMQVYHPDMDSTPYTNLTFWLNGGASGGQKLQVYGLLHVGTSPNAGQGYYTLGPLATNTWQQITIPLSALGVASRTNFTGFVIQDTTGAAQPAFYVDDISLVAANPPLPPGAITVDAMANRHPISPLIYGVAWTSSNVLSDLNLTINRAGGNAETRYNWQLNAHNRASDWFFESLSDGPALPGAAADGFITDTRNGGAQPMITIPMIGWMSKLGPGRAGLASYSIAKYGPQTGNDPWFSDAGNGIGTNAATRNTWTITTNNPTDANFPTNAVFQEGFVQHLLGKWGASTNGGVRFYIMDNEESIWFATHRDVHPVGPTMQEIFNDVVAYAGMVKSYDPNSSVCVGEEWGWNGYLNSGYDLQNPGQTDRAAHGGWDYMPWLLNQLHQHDLGAGQRLVDYFTVHCYPQEGNVGSGSDVSAATDLLRNRSTRVLWDPNYVDESWINTTVCLIPRMKSWVATNYPGTKIGITEYNWGAETNINGATAQADLFGIFGREGLDLATRWGTPPAGSPTYNAMKMFRNYDGNKSTFGDASILTTMPSPDYISAFGSIRTSDGALTLMVVIKDVTNATPIAAGITNFNHIGFAQRWQLTSSNVISHLANVTLTNSVLTDILPSQSITLFVLPTVSPFALQVASNSPPRQLGIWLNGQAGQTYVLQSSADLLHWAAVSTNLAVSNSFEIFLTTTNSAHVFYRAIWNHP